MAPLAPLGPAGPCKMRNKITVTGKAKIEDRRAGSHVHRTLDRAGALRTMGASQRHWDTGTEVLEGREGCSWTKSHEVTDSGAGGPRRGPAGYSRGGREALQDRWGQMLLGCPEVGRGLGQVGRPRRLQSTHSHRTAASRIPPRRGSRPYPLDFQAYTLHPPSRPSVQRRPEGQEVPGHPSLLALQGGRSVQ